MIIVLYTNVHVSIHSSATLSQCCCLSQKELVVCVCVCVCVCVMRDIVLNVMTIVKH